MDWTSIISAIISFLAGSGLFGLLGRRAKKILKNYSEQAADGLQSARKIIDDYQDGKISREEARRQVQELERLGNWVKENVLKSGKKSSATGKMTKVILLFVPVLLLSAGCSTYGEYIAPHIPTVSVEAEVGGQGLGAGIGFESRWTGEDRERRFTVRPEIKKDEE